MKMTMKTTNDPSLHTDGPGVFCPTCGHFAARHMTAPDEPGCTFTRALGDYNYIELGATCDCPGWPIPEEEPMNDLPHSRACGIGKHDHGVECHSNCPTCHGRPMETVGLAGSFSEGLREGKKGETDRVKRLKQQLIDEELTLSEMSDLAGWMFGRATRRAFSDTFEKNSPDE